MKIESKKRPRGVGQTGAQGAKVAGQSLRVVASGGANVGGRATRHAPSARTLAGSSTRTRAGAKDAEPPALPVSDARAASIVEACGAMLILTDVTGTIRSFNAFAERTLGYPLGEALGSRVTRFFVAAELDARAEQATRELGVPVLGDFRACVAIAAARRTPDTGEWTLVRRDGTRIVASIAFAPLFDGRGTIEGYVVTAQDVTAQRASDRHRRELVSTVSHELRTPLASIIAALGLIQQRFGSALPEQARELAEIANRNAEQLHRLVDDILDLERLELGLLSIQRVPVELRALVGSVVQGMANVAHARSVQLALQRAPREFWVDADPDRLIQVVSNLLSNAIKFTREGSTVTVGILAGPAGIRVSVSDQGHGIPVAFQARVFQPFAQASAKAATRGTGLGLSICKGIVEQLGGRIGFETRVGRGTTFHFDLPELNDDA